MPEAVSTFRSRLLCLLRGVLGLTYQEVLDHCSIITAPSSASLDVASKIILSSNATLKKKIMFRGVRCVLEPVNHWSGLVECFEVSCDIPDLILYLLHSGLWERQSEAWLPSCHGNRKKKKKVYPNLKIAVYSSQTSQPGLNCSTFSFFSSQFHLICTSSFDSVFLLPLINGTLWICPECFRDHARPWTLGSRNNGYFSWCVNTLLDSASPMQLCSGFLSVRGRGTCLCIYPVFM